MAYGTKSAIKAQYLAALESTYAWAQKPGPARDRGLALAAEAADKALAGKIKLRGEQWEKALADNGVPFGGTMKMLAALPD